MLSEKEGQGVTEHQEEVYLKCSQTEGNFRQLHQV